MSHAASDRDTKTARAREEAAEWLLVLQQLEVTDEEARRFNDWLSAPPNRHAFDLVLRSWEQSAALQRVRRPSVAELHDDDYDGSVPVAVHLARQRGEERLARSVVAKLRDRKGWMMAAAASVAAVALLITAIVVLSSGIFREQSQMHATGTGQHREVRLADGSVVTLGARSAISVRFARGKRTVVLDHGTALFEVAHDKKRPFVVMAARGRATALGTVFSVRRDQDEVTVSVVDGKVQVDEGPGALASRTDNNDMRASLRSGRTAVLVKGERVSYGADGQLGAVERTDPALAIAWRSGLLAYRNEPLIRVVHDLNRYSQRPIVLGDRPTEQMRFTGTVQVADGQRRIDQWVWQLQSVLPVEVVAEDQQVVVRSHPALP